MTSFKVKFIVQATFIYEVEMEDKEDALFEGETFLEYSMTDAEAYSILKQEVEEGEKEVGDAG